jgi:hypothetical protein
MTKKTNSLKGQCHKIFASGFFHEPSSSSQGALTVSTTSVAKLPPVSNDTGQQILPPVPQVLLIPVAHLPPVSMTQAANKPVASCHRYQ